MRKKLTPERLLLISFAGAILIGSILLSLPAASKGERLSYIDALFTSTSAVCVTGLIVKDTGKDFTLFGQLVILGLLQLGGLGLMTFSSIIFILMGRGVSIISRSALQQSFTPTGLGNFSVFLKNILIYTFSVEALGAALLYPRFSTRFPAAYSFFASVFHSISAFCNAGFSIFSDSLMSWREDIWVNAVVLTLIVVGGLGFFVFWDLKEKLLGRREHLSLHTKMVLAATAFLILWGTFLLFTIEFHRAFSGFSLKGKILASLFQSITPRTAGFNTVDIASLSLPSLLLLIWLMFIGASPGSTGGGVKTTTGFLGFLAMRKILTKKEQVQAFGRGIREEAIERALVLMVFFISFHFFSTFLLSLTENFSFIQLAFEEMSAMGTVGLSTGITPRLSTWGKLIIIVSMYVGRVGPLTILSSLVRRSRGRFTLPYESVMIG